MSRPLSSTALTRPPSPEDLADSGQPQPLRNRREIPPTLLALVPRVLAGWWVWGPVAVVIAALWPRLAMLALHEDNGVVTMWGLQIAAGRVPYRDFMVYTAPVIAYLYGAAFHIFGSSLLVSRILDAVPLVIGTIFLALIARRFLPVKWAAGVTLLWGAWLPAFLGNGSYHFWGPVLILVAVWALLRPQPRFAIAGGAAAGALLFNQGMATAVLTLLLVAYLTRRRWRDVAVVAAGPALAGVVLGVALLATGTLPAFIDQTIGFTSGRYQEFNHRPFPFNPLLLADTLEWHIGAAKFWAFPMFWLLGVAVPFAVAGYAVIAVGLAVRRREGLPPVAILAIISTGLLASVFVARVGGPICWLHAPLALVLLAMRLRIWAASPSDRRRVAVLAPVVFLYVTGLIPAPLGFWMSCTTDPASSLTTAVDTAAGRACLRFDEASELRSVQAALGRRAAPIAFLPDSPGLYQLTGSAPTVPSYWTMPRHTRPSEVAWMESAMLSVNTAVYVDDTYLDTGHPWQFDDYLAANFDVVARSPGVTIFTRKSQAP